MQLSGIHLTEQGSPVASGQIGLFRNGKPYALRQHQSVILLSYKNKGREMVCLHENQLDKDQTSGFYQGLPETQDADFTFFFPRALTIFVQGQLSQLRPGLTDNTAFESTQTVEKRSPEMGSLYARIPQSNDFVHLVVNRMAVSVNHKTNGMDLEILAELKSAGRGPWASKATDRKFDHKADYRLDISCNVNRETAEFRYGGGIQQEKSAAGLTRYYPGDEVQTDLTNLNIKHPLIHNTGGLYALSSEGVHAVDLSGPARIQPVKLRGWGWGSVYEADTVWGHDQLTLPFITKPFLEHHIDAMGVMEGDVLRSHLSLRGGDMGSFAEDASKAQLSRAGALNERDVEAIDIDFSIDRFGMTMAIDAKLSRAKNANYKDSGKSAQGPRYTKALMFPWEVLICRDFYLPKFARYWYSQRLKNPQLMTSKFSEKLSQHMKSIFLEKEKILPFHLKN